MMWAAESRGRMFASTALRRHSNTAFSLARRCSAISGAWLIRCTMAGWPSESNCSSYFLPLLSVAAQEVLEIFPGPAGEIAAGDRQRAAAARHRHDQVDVVVLLLLLRDRNGGP